MIYIFEITGAVNFNSSLIITVATTEVQIFDQPKIQISSKIQNEQSFSTSFSARFIQVNVFIYCLPHRLF